MTDILDFRSAQADGKRCIVVKPEWDKVQCNRILF